MKIFYKTPLGETGCSGNPYFVTGCLSIQSSDSPPFPQHLCDLQETMPRHWSPSASHPIPFPQHLCDLRDAMTRHWSPSDSHQSPYLGKQRISPGVAIILSMCLYPHTQLDCNQFTMILDLYLYMSNSGYFCLW